MRRRDMVWDYFMGPSNAGLQVCGILSPSCPAWESLVSRCLSSIIVCNNEHSFLPDGQSDGRDLARQGEARHPVVSSLWQPKPRGNSGKAGRTLEEIFQIVVMIFVEPADGNDFLGAPKLAAHNQISRGTRVRV